MVSPSTWFSNYCFIMYFNNKGEENCYKNTFMLSSIFTYVVNFVIFLHLIVLIRVELSFYFSLKTPSWRAGLPTTDFLIFCLSWYILMSPFLKHSFWLKISFFAVFFLHPFEYGALLTSSLQVLFCFVLYAAIFFPCFFQDFQSCPFYEISSRSVSFNAT